MMLLIIPYLSRDSCDYLSVFKIDKDISLKFNQFSLNTINHITQIYGLRYTVYTKKGVYIVVILRCDLQRNS
jgi:hypothetical protein